MPNCCDEYGNCNQGRDCPVRAGYAHRKVRAGKPLSDDTGCLPVQFTEDQIAKWDAEVERQRDMDRETVRDFWLALAITVALVVVLIAWLFGVVGIAP